MGVAILPWQGRLANRRQACRLAPVRFRAEPSQKRTQGGLRATTCVITNSRSFNQLEYLEEAGIKRALRGTDGSARTMDEGRNPSDD